MTANEPAKSPRWSSKTSSSKGDSTRHSILLAATQAFGDAGFEAVSTREIARLAKVNQPAINYYFKGKKELYRACAEAIVGEFTERTEKAALDAFALLQSRTTPAPARLREALSRLISELSVVLISSDRHQYWSAFVAREIRNPGPAHEVIFKQLWEPGIELVARLISAIKGKPETDPQSRIEAIFLLSSLVGFGAGRAVPLRIMGWTGIGTPEQQMIKQVIDQQIAAITGDAG